MDDLKKLVAVLIQADRFGTGVAQSLRAHADFMRIQARQEKAAKLGVKLIFPIFFCILPSLLVVTIGPVAMKIVRELIPTMTMILKVLAREVELIHVRKGERPMLDASTVRVALFGVFLGIIVLAAEEKC